MRNDRIAVMGDKDCVLAFRAAGADVFPVVGADDAGKTLKKLARTYPVILVTEDIAESIVDIVDRYKASPYPAVIPIPGATGGTGYAMRRISENVEKALGTNILDD